MSDNVAIGVEHLIKLFHINASPARYRTFREAVVEGLAAPWRRDRRAFRGSSSEQTSTTIWALKDANLEVQPGEILVGHL
jgi:hypothetical protein